MKRNRKSNLEHEEPSFSIFKEPIPSKLTKDDLDILLKESVKFAGKSNEMSKYRKNTIILNQMKTKGIISDKEINTIRTNRNKFHDFSSKLYMSILNSKITEKDELLKTINIIRSMIWVPILDDKGNIVNDGKTNIDFRKEFVMTHPEYSDE